jgi:hypothetical protein
MPLEERVKAAVDGLEARLEDQYSIEAIKVGQAWDNAAGGGVRSGGWCDALNERARRKLVADWCGELARRERFLGLLDAG